MKGIELLIGQVKPSGMKASDPFMSEDKNQEPDKQNSIIDDRAPQKKVADSFNGHFASSFSPTVITGERSFRPVMDCLFKAVFPLIRHVRPELFPGARQKNLRATEENKRPDKSLSCSGRDHADIQLPIRLASHSQSTCDNRDRGISLVRFAGCHRKL